FRLFLGKIVYRGGDVLKIVTFNNHQLGVQVDEGIIDVNQALQQVSNEHVVYDVMQLREGGKEALQELTTFITELATLDKSYVKTKEEVEWGPALTRPRKIICVGLNYKKHADETKAAYPEFPIIFNKFDNALTGHQSNITVPRTTKRLDHEVELGIVMGKTGKFIDKDNALDYVFGYCTTNDISARDLQKRVPQWMTGKTNDGFAPVGPYLVTKDEVDNPDSLNITTKVNGEIRQNSNTSDMI